MASRGIRRVRVYNGALSREVAHVDTPGVAQDVAVSGRNVVVADGSEGVQIMRYRPNLVDGLGAN